MLICLRNNMMVGKNLPYAAEVEFLESDSLAFINTGILPNNITKWECRASFSKYYTSGYFFGAYKGENYNNARIVLQTTDNGNAWSNCGSKTGVSTPAINGISKNVFYDFKCERTQQSVTSYKDGVQQTTVSFVAGDYNDQPITLFQRQVSNPEARDIGCRIASFKLWENGVIVRDFIPVLDNSGVACMYDRVTGKLFYNAGTGAFTYGPVIWPSARDYVQNGLIAMWDGIENAGWGIHDPNATTWKDLSGNDNDLTLKNGANFDSNSLVSAPRNYVSALISKTFPYATIEACAFNDVSRNSSSVICFGNSVDDNRMLSASPNNVQGKNGTYQYPTADGIAKATWAATYNGDTALPYKNGSLVISTPTNNSWSVRSGSFGLSGSSNYNSYNFVGNYYSVRIYSRALTADEIAHNYAIDKARFNIPY